MASRAEIQVSLDGSPLTVAQVVAVARNGGGVSLSDDARSRIERSRALLEEAITAGEPLYGVNTGFGSLSRTRIEPDRLAEVQRNLLRSHAAGVGDPLPTDVVRAMMLLLAASLSRGASGVRVQVVETLIAMLNAGVTPIVPAVGSVGASGDLAPLSHAAIVMLGEGEADVGGKRIAGGEALRNAGIEPIELGAKEGLALINGTHLMCARAALLLRDLDHVVDAAITACAMSIDGARATDAFLDPRVHDVRKQSGQRVVASRLRELLAGSAILSSHEEDDPRVQDPYSFRCAPVVLGAAMDIIATARRVIEDELGAVTDNPLVFEPVADGDPIVVSAGNFHGMPLAIQMDALAIALSHIAGISERRVYHMLSAWDPQAELPAHLSPRPGLMSGLMITQYTAAACCNEIIQIATPASVANIPTCAGMEDYNSFGPTSASKLRRGIDLARSVVAIELLCAAQALEYHRPLMSGTGVERAFEKIRSVVPPLEADRPPAPDIAALERQIAIGAFS